MLTARRMSSASGAAILLPNNVIHFGCRGDVTGAGTRRRTGGAVAGVHGCAATGPPRSARRGCGHGLETGSWVAQEGKTKGPGSYLTGSARTYFP